MPNIKSAKKKMKQDLEKRAQNKNYAKKIEDIMNHMQKKVTGAKKEDMISKAYSLIDKAAKKNVIHGNKANRLKTRVTRLIAK